MIPYQTKRLVVQVLAVVAVLFGSSTAANAVETVTEGFDDFSTSYNASYQKVLNLPDGWNYGGDVSLFIRENDLFHAKKPAIQVEGTNTSGYLITPKLTGEFSFYLRNRTKNYQASVKAYACTYADGVLTLGDEIGSTTLAKTTSPTFQQVAFTANSETRVALLLSNAIIDDVTYTPVKGEGGGEGGGGTTPDPQPEPAPVMTVSTTTVNFGRVAANVSETVTLGNTGNAELQAAVTVDNADFTVSPSYLTVAAGETGTFTISYQYNAEAYGSHTASVTITPNAGDPATIAVSAYVRNPNVWNEDFSGNALPNGWKADASNWTIADGVAHGKYVYGSTGYLMTPILKVAAGEVMTFEYKATANNVKVSVEASKDGSDFAEIKNSGWVNKMDEFAVITIDGLSAGNYQFRFASDDYDLDNFEGFNLNLDAPVLVVTPTTDAAFGKVSTQPEAKTYTVTNDGTGTLAGTIASSDATQFTVSKSSFSLAAGESTTFDVALVMGESYGDKTATITIHPTNEGLADVVINATATLLDPNQWTETFDEGSLPNGWLNNGWSFGTSTAFADNTTPMALAPQSETSGTLTTPRLQAKAGDVLSWDAYLRWSDEVLLVEYTDDDQATWHTIYNYKAEDEGQSDKYVKAMSFTAPADGTYRLRFTSKMQNGLDNFSGFALAPSTAVTETWHISFTFHYKDEGGEQAEEGTEDIDVEFDGDKVGFNFPNPMSGNAWMYGTRYEQDNIVYYIFPMGQYVGKYQGENVYYCGGANETLTDMQFFYNDDDKAFFNFEHVLLNGSTTTISLWAYFSDVVIYKDQKPVIDPDPTGIREVANGQQPTANSHKYNLRGQKVDSSYKGIVIQNGKKYLVK